MVTITTEPETYGQAKRMYHNKERLEELLTKSEEYRVEELEDNEGKPYHQHMTPWGNGDYMPDDLIVQLLGRAVKNKWIENYYTDFFRDGQAIEKTEAPYIYMIRKSGTQLISFETFQIAYNCNVTEWLEHHHYLDDYEKGTVRLFYIDVGYIGEIVV